MSGVIASRRLLNVLFLIVLAAGLAIQYRSWIPATAMVPLVSMVLVAYAEVLLPLPRWAVRKVATDGVMLRDDEAQVDVTMGFCVMPYNLTVRERLPEGLVVKDGSPSRFRIKDRRLHGHYIVEARRRGDWDLGPMRVVRQSMLGLFERSVYLPMSTQITVLPVTAKQHGLRLRPKTLMPEGIPTRNRRHGGGDTFYALREFASGDSLSDVNWKATARHGKPIVNEFLPDEPARYMIYIDTRAFGAEVGTEDVFERTMELSAALVEGLITAHAHVGLVMVSYHASFKVPAGGAVHNQKLRRMILQAKPGAEAPLLTLVEAGAVHLPRRTAAILVTPNLYEPTLQQALMFLRAHHGRVQLLVPAFPEPEGDRKAPQRTAGALLNADQAAVLADLAPYTNGAAQWPPTEPIPVTLGRMGLIGGGRR